MLKKINVTQLAIGMHIKEFCGSEIEHPFWCNDFVIKNLMDIQTIVESNISEVWIDTEKGKDVYITDATLGNQNYTPTQAQSSDNSERKTQPTSVTAQQEYQRAAQICENGKPLINAMFQEARMGRAIETDGAKQLVEEITDSINRNPHALISLARLKQADTYTFMHSVAVCALMVALSKQLKLDEQQTRSAGLAGLFHDLGKSVIPLEVLNKPGKLTEEEFDLVKTHARQGYQILSNSHFSDLIALDVVLHHHEKVDGSGYPDGLKGNQITQFAKMGAVCDVYDAITSDRPYKQGWHPAEALHKMAEWSTGHLDRLVFQAFVKSVGIYPIGSLVRLNTGRLGIVLEQGKKSLLTPLVKVFFSTRQKIRIRPEIIDLSMAHCPEIIVGREDPARWNFPDLATLWQE
jgi:HD-GYP domain-containing protein (c-di-GMP phosphodiesterase class II)